MEGGALQGMSRALHEEVTWSADSSAITSVDWKTYPVLPFGDALPVIETVLTQSTERAATGRRRMYDHHRRARPSAMRFSMPRAPGYARFRLRPRGCWQRWRLDPKIGGGWSIYAALDDFRPGKHFGVRGRSTLPQTF